MVPDIHSRLAQTGPCHISLTDFGAKDLPLQLGILLYCTTWRKVFTKMFHFVGQNTLACWKRLQN